jgi:hypothetical protein
LISRFVGPRLWGTLIAQEGSDGSSAGTGISLDLGQYCFGTLLQLGVAAPGFHPLIDGLPNGVSHRQLFELGDHGQLCVLVFFQTDGHGLHGLSSWSTAGFS